MSLFVYVDDTDGAISYTGSWTLATNTFLDTGNWGPPYKQTLHGASSSGSLTYRFSGTNVRLTGLSPPGRVDGLSWECFVDDRSLGTIGPASARVNNWKFCDSGRLSNGEHTFRLVVTITGDATFWFDRLEYTPGPDLELSGKDILLENGHSLMSFGGDWETTAIEHRTQMTDAAVTISFSGTSLTWFAFVPSGFPSSSGRATYRIDDESDVSFQTAQINPGGSERFNQVLFQTRRLSPGPHTLTATFRGDDGNAPLVLDKVVVEWQGAAVDPPSPPTVGGGGSSGGGGSGSGGSVTTTIVSDGTTRTITTSTPVSPTTSPGSTGTTPSTNIPTDSFVAPDPSQTDGQSGNSTSSNVANPTSTGASAPAIAGIAVGSTLLAVALVVALFLLYRRRRRRQNQAQHSQLPSTSTRSLGPNDNVTHSSNLRAVSPFDDPRTSASQDVHSISPSDTRFTSSARTPSPQLDSDPSYSQVYVIPPSKHRPLDSLPQTMDAVRNNAPDDHHYQPPMVQTGKGAIIAPTIGTLSPLRATHATAGDSLDSRSDATGPSTDTSSFSILEQRDYPRMVRRHEDSGLRIARYESILDLPPNYTAR